MAVSYHDRVTKLQDLSHRPRGPFDRLEWFDLLSEEDEHAIFVHCGENGDTVTLPLRREENSFRSLTNWFTFAWRPLGESTENLVRIARDLRSRTHEVTVAPVPSEDGTIDLLTEAFREANWIVLRERCDENHILRLRGRTFAEYWSTRPGPLRTSVKRKAKKVSIEIHCKFDEIIWSEYQSVYENSWKPEEVRSDMLKRFAMMEGAAGRLRLGIAKANGEPIAAQFWTVENDTAYIHKLAHLETAKSLSPGTSLSAAMFEHAIDKDGVDLIDFGTGSDKYKHDWMEEVRYRYRLTFFDWRNRRAWLPIGKALLRRLARRFPRR